MKTRYLFAIGASLALLLLWYVWNSRLAPEKDNAAAFVPRDALVFAEQKNIGGLIDGFKASRMGKAVAAIDIRRVAADIGLAEEQAAGLTDTVKVIEDLGNSRLFREFCGNTVALALLPGDPASAGQTAAALPFQVLLIARPQHNTELFELLSSVATGNVQQSEVDYKGHKLKKFEIDGTMVFAVTVDGFFLLSLQEDILHKALDTASQASISLAELAAFKQLRGQYSRLDFFAYTSLAGVRREMPAATRQDAADRGTADRFASLAGLQYSAYGMWREEGLLRDRSITLIDRQGLDPQIRKLLSAAPEHNDTLALVPADILTYYWSNTFALASIWQMYKEKYKADSRTLDEFTRKFNKTTGSDVEKVLALIDGGVSLFLSKGDDTTFIPLPHFAVFIKLNDRRQMEEVINKTTTAFDIPLQENTYKNVTFTAYGQTLPGGLQALWGFHENFLILANSRQMLEKIVDTREGGNGLQKSKTYTGMRMDLESGNNSVCFIRMAELVDGIQELAGWGGIMVAIQNREAAAKSKALIDGVINPLLDGLRMFSTIATRSRLAEDRVVIESAIQLEAKPSSGQGR